MGLREKITSDLKEAMKAQDVLRRDTLRMLDSSIRNVEIEKKKRETGLSEEEITEVVRRSVKQRQDSIKQFIEGGRSDLAQKEKDELEILLKYMPEQLDEESIRKIVQEVIVELNANSAADMGKVMGTVMAKVKGMADGNVVRTIVSQELAGAVS